MSFAVCSAVDCQPETEKVLNATIAVSNNHFAVSKNMNSGSVRGLVLKSTPIQPKDPTDEEVAWNVSVETALSAGGTPPSSSLDLLATGGVPYRSWWGHVLRMIL